MNNALLNGVERSQEEVGCLVLQIPITRMSRQILFLQTAGADERNLLLKDYEILQQMDPDSDNMHSNCILKEYQTGLNTWKSIA